MAEEHKPLYIFVAVLFLMGVVFGALMVNALTFEQKSELSRFFGSFIHTLQSGTMEVGVHELRDAFMLHVKWLILIWVLAVSVIGFPLILFVNFLKGMLVGFTTGYLMSEWTWKGMLFAFVGVVPQNIVLIPAFMIASVCGISFSLYFIRHRLIQQKGPLGTVFLSFSGRVLLLAGIIMIVACYETYVSPLLMRLVY